MPDAMFRPLDAIKCPAEFEEWQNAALAESELRRAFLNIAIRVPDAFITDDSPVISQLRHSSASQSHTEDMRIALEKWEDAAVVAKQKEAELRNAVRRALPASAPYRYAPRSESQNLAWALITDPTDTAYKSLPPATTDVGDVRVVFRDWEQEIIAYIGAYEAFVGCVAWLTNEAVLSALADKPCQILVQKEDFLRPDAGGKNSARAQHLRPLYANLQSIAPDHYNLPGGATFSPFNWGPDSGLMLEAVRCVGVRNLRGRTTPLMHHKFLVGGRTDRSGDQYAGEYFVPQAVWTGSANLTANGTRSAENCLIMKNGAVARAYYEEWGRLLGISEPLDWDSEYMEPEWRVGT